MRWRALFADLEAQAEAFERAELDQEVRDRTRREAGLIGTVERLRGAVGAEVVLTVEGAGPVPCRLLDAGRDWVLGEQAPGRDVLVPLPALLSATGLTGRADAVRGSVAQRLDLRWALRGLVRDRAAVQVVLRDGSLLSGTLDRVGADHVELAEHPQGEARRAAAVRGLRLVPLAALSVVRSL